LFSKVITTPNILTEVSNLAARLKDQTTGKLKHTVLEQLRAVFAERIEVVQEEYVESRLASHDTHFGKVGLTDAAIVKVGLDRKCLVLTDDAALAQILSDRNVDVMNFNAIRQYQLGLRGPRFR